MRSNIPRNNINNTNNSISDSFYQPPKPPFNNQRQRIQQKPKQPLSSYESEWDDSSEAAAVRRKVEFDSNPTFRNHNSSTSISTLDSKVNKLNSTKSNSKLYTFYDYINKKNNTSNNNNNNKNSEDRLNLDNKRKNNANPYSRYSYNSNNNNNINNSFEESNYNEIIELNTPVFEENKFQTSSEAYNRRRVSPSSPLPVSPLADPYYITMPISSGFGGYTGTTRRKPQPKVKI
jgi:hypothetical protein